MKKLALLFAFMSLTIQAQSTRSLQTVMSDLGISFKIVVTAIQSGTISPELVIESEKVVQFIVESEAITPDIVLSLPNVEQESAKAKYVQQMKDLEKAAIELNLALKAGNVEQAKLIVTQLNGLKKIGHKDFK